MRPFLFSWVPALINVWLQPSTVLFLSGASQTWPLKPNLRNNQLFISCTSSPLKPPSLGRSCSDISSFVGTYLEKHQPAETVEGSEQQTGRDGDLSTVGFGKASA